MAQAVEEKEEFLTGRESVDAAGFRLPSAKPEDISSQGDSQKQKEQKKRRDAEFLEMLAAYYQVGMEHFDTLKAADETPVRPLLESFMAVNRPASTAEPLVARNMMGSQESFDIRPDSVMTGKGTRMTMELAIEMALAAKANPAFAKGVDVTGSKDERAMLAAAAEIAGLRVLNMNKVDLKLAQSFMTDAQSVWAKMKADAAQRATAFDEESDAPVKKVSEADKKPEPMKPIPVATPTKDTKDSEPAGPVESETEDETVSEAKPTAPQEKKEIAKPESEKTASAKPERDPVAYASLDPDIQKKIRDHFRALNKEEIGDNEIEKRWNEWPRSAREIAIADDFKRAAEKTALPREEKPAAAPVQMNNNIIVMPAADKKIQDEKPSSPLAAGFAQAQQQKNVLDAPKTAAQILKEGNVSPDLYALVRLRVIADNDARVKHIEDIIGFDNNIPGSRKATPVILKALEAEGVVVQEKKHGRRRVVHPGTGKPSSGAPQPG